MPYHLECEESFSSADATEADINRAFDDDRLRGEYVILTAPNGDFMQAAGDDDGPYVLEHRTAETGEHIQSVGSYAKEEIRNAFLAYLRGDESWHGQFNWQPHPEFVAPSHTVGACDRFWMCYEGLFAHRRVYAIIGGVIAGIVIAVALGAWLWLTFF